MIPRALAAGLAGLLLPCAGDSWQDALRGYVEEMARWVEAVREGKPVEDVIPVNVAPTREWADLLASRLEFLRTNLVEVDPDSVENDV